MTDYTDKNEKKQVDSIVKFNSKKEANFKLPPLIHSKVSPNTVNRIDTCGENLLFLSDILKEKKRLKTGFFCGNRWCPMCAWRKARKDATKLGVCMTYLKEKFRYEFIFLTLTTPNVKECDLESEIKKFNASFMKMMKWKRVRGFGQDFRGNFFNGAVNGYVRKLEVTYNAERDDYNPHFHVLIAVNKSYFDNSKKYISQKEWLELWQKATGMPEITQVNVQKVGGKNKKENAVLEVAKYSAKDSEYLASEEVFNNFYSSLKHKRLVVFGGVLRDAAEKFDKGELDSYLLKDETEYVYEIIAKFNYKSLRYEQEYRKMSLEKAEKVKNEIEDSWKNGQHYKREQFDKKKQRNSKEKKIETDFDVSNDFEPKVVDDYLEVTDDNLSKQVELFGVGTIIVE